MNDEQHIEQELQKLFSELSFSKPSIDFSANIMERIAVAQQKALAKQKRYTYFFAIIACLFVATGVYVALLYLPLNTLSNIGFIFSSILNPLVEAFKVLHHSFKVEYIYPCIAALLLLLGDLYFRKAIT